jgi:hypothetical protein
MPISGQAENRRMEEKNGTKTERLDRGDTEKHSASNLITEPKK